MHWKEAQKEEKDNAVLGKGLRLQIYALEGRPKIIKGQCSPR
jgi:hypothetical protein